MGKGLDEKHLDYEQHTFASLPTVVHVESLERTNAAKRTISAAATRHSNTLSNKLFATTLFLKNN